MNYFDNIFKDLSKQNISGLTDELKCIYIYNKFKNDNNSYLFVCNSLFEANKIYDTLRNYTNDVLFFPMDDFITSEILAISPEFKATRLETLNELRNNKKIVVTNLAGYLRFLPAPNIFYNSYINIIKNSEYKISELTSKLITLGYTRETTVDKSGTIAVRGYVLDIFPINSKNPIRIEFWGDEVESIRTFNIDTQLAFQEINSIEIMSNTELLSFNTEVQKQSDIANEAHSIKDYLLNSMLVYNDYDDLKISYFNLEKEMLDYSISKGLSNIKYMHSFEELDNQNNINMCKYDNNVDINYDSYILDIKFNKMENINEILSKYIKNNTIIICLSSRYQINKLQEIIPDSIFTDANNIINNKINMIIKKINEGYIFSNYIVISEQEIFNTKNIYKSYKSNFKYGTKIKDISKISIGDYIVHNVHGIGRYCGIKTLTKNGLMKDYLQIEYKDNDSLYIPVEKIELISKYSSNDGYVPKLNKLGTTEWEKTKLKARKRASSIAKELINLYAIREMKEGYAFDKDDEDQINFEKEFAFTPTESQLKVMDEIKSDMESNHPMDRLLCGDVGFGKTELAFRAAFKAILSSKQVILLCPTTILASQHYLNALERFKSFPVNIRLLNRFVTEKETRNIFEGLKNGTVDFVIGTHKLLNDSIEYKNLGLLIIDEEQRFGVTHKEKIKKYKNNIDVLTLSATPIPRTLQMSMSGVRSLSLLETPPSNRYPVQTYVVAYDKKLIKDAIYREISRNGQVFLLYNRIDNIELKAKEISTLVPEAKVVYAHGRMSKKELEDIMLKFTNKEFDVLLCTTIIETGIDIPNVNTLIVINAELFGLSQLYQLRGRVGRTNKIAYCYLTYDSSRVLSEVANKRLNSIKEFTELGSGLSIAMRDLSIRGAGDILGSEQAGFIDTIGIELFTKILKEEIDKLKGIEVEEEDDTSMPLIDVDTYVDDKYISDEELKIEIHKMINEIDSYDKLLDIKSKIEDRFGKTDEKLVIYMYEQWFEAISNKLKIQRVKQNENQIEIIFSKEMTKKIDGEKLFVDAYCINKGFKFGLSLGCLSIKLNIKNLDKHFVYYLVDLMKLVEKAI